MRRLTYAIAIATFGWPVLAVATVWMVAGAVSEWIRGG